MIMEQDIPEKEKQQDQETKRKSRFYDKPWIRITALILALSMIFSIWANGAIHVRIQRGEDMDAATNYLVDNTDYVNQGDLQRFQEKLLAYQQATQLEDYYRLAGTQIAAEQYDEALASIESCLELYPGGDDALYVDLLLKRACLLVLLLREEEALTALDKVLEQQPDHADAYLIKAQIYAERQQLEPLMEALAVYLEHRPEEYTIRMVYAQSLFELQHFEEAAEEYQKLLEENTGQLGENELWYLLGLTQLQLNDYAQCEEALEKAKVGDPGLEGLDYYIGICQMSREAYTEAVESFTAAIEAGSMLQHCHYSRGVCRLMLGDQFIESAQEDLVYASGYDGADADANVKLQADDLLAELQGVINVP
jgi:tetratricopeptide (TPR) repeat protein